MAHLIAAIVMTSNVYEGHSPTTSVFKCDILYLWQVTWSLCICRASCYHHSVDLFTKLHLHCANY